MATRNLALFPDPAATCVCCGGQTELHSVALIVYRKGPAVAGMKRQLSSRSFNVCAACALSWSRVAPRPKLRSAFRTALQGILRRFNAQPMG